ncbi:MAG TPA: flagellar basal body P-ring formation chaperone FlgA [Haliangiales bacterium]|nr:flagellar basal body P-ring formation chaperone FlgA [Haliangiales bacterium]
MAAAVLSTVAGAAEAKGVQSAIEAAAARVIPADLAVTGVTVPPSLPWPRGAVASVEWRTAPRAGKMSVRVAVYQKEKIVGQGWAQLDIAPVREVVVARRALRAGDPVAAADVARERRPSTEGGAWEVDPQVLVGSPAMRDIRAGEVVTKIMVAGPPPIARGTGVDVVARRGGVVVSTRGTLERAARPGEATVARTASGLLVKGRLADAHTLIVEGDR